MHGIVSGFQWFHFKWEVKNPYGKLENALLDVSLRKIHRWMFDGLKFFKEKFMINAAACGDF